MLQQVSTIFKAHADPSEILDRAKAYKNDVRALLWTTRNLVRLLDAGTPVCTHEVSDVIDKAESLNLVSRAGMKQSGLYFVVHEPEMKVKQMGITADEAMSAVHHVALQVRRANNILNRKSGAYSPNLAAPLYGRNVDGWEQLIP